MKLFSVFLLLQFIVAFSKVTEPPACPTKALKTSELSVGRRRATTHALDLRGGGTSRFDGEVETRWLVHGDHDRDMKLLRSFTFVDKNGRRWTAPRGFDVDGASIPRPLWVTFGSPYVGDYRRASVVHDYFCKPGWIFVCFIVHLRE